MLFRLAIRIKAEVNQFNRERRRMGFPVISFDCDSFAVGKWSLRLRLSDNGCFFSDEIKRLSALSSSAGILFYVGSDNVSPVLHFQ